MLPQDEYTQAHLFVAAIRVFEHRNGQGPSLRGLADMLCVSEEELSLLSRKLEEKGIIGVIATGGQERFMVRDHTRIEGLPKEAAPLALEDEISRFKAKQESHLKDLEERLSRSRDKSGVFSELEKALKDPERMKKKNPLD